jgi:YHS domain-containing protein
MPQREQSDTTAIDIPPKQHQYPRRNHGQRSRLRHDIDEINVPESLQAEREDRMYYFCSPACKLEFDQDPAKFISRADRHLKHRDAA